MLELKFTLCFVRHKGKFLMLYRNKPPNQYKWNGVGGKIEPGESPMQAILREIKEESGLEIPVASFRGIVTWENTSRTYVGGMYVFVADSPTAECVSGEEGSLQWKSLEWIVHSGEAVSNIPIFLPPMLAEDHQPVHHAFIYDDEGEILAHDVKPIAESILSNLQFAGVRDIHLYR